MATGRDLLEALKELEKTSPQKLDEPLFATYGNDENGNADIIPIQALLPAYDESVNLAESAFCAELPHVVVLDDEGKESVIDLLDEVIGMLEHEGRHMMQEDYERFQEIKAKVNEIRQNANAL